MSGACLFAATAWLLQPFLSPQGLLEGVRPWDREGTRPGEEIVGPDGSPMVWVPAGEFNMGWERGCYDEKPVHRVRITKGFWLGKVAVTNAQYRRYCLETGAKFPEGSAQGDDHPVVDLSWDDAVACCRHYGLSLPTEAQWEYAARGPDGCIYPWGNEWDPTKCCWEGNKGPGGETYPVGSFPQGASWCGALDMAGNSWDWCQDWYSPTYYASAPRADPPGPSTGHCRVLRGGSWHFVVPRHLRSSYRHFCGPTARDSYVYGFRCARTF